MNELVFKGDSGKALTTSLIVAETFGKAHDKVLRDIRELACSQDFRLSNFGESSYQNIQNKEMPMYVITKDGFTLLAMGYTGAKAMAFKEKYIAAFNQMERLIQESLSKPKSPSELFAMQVQVNLDFEKRVSNIEGKVAKIERMHDEATKQLFTLPLSENKMPEKSLKAKVNELVRSYAAANQLTYQDVWHKVYKELYYTYHISINSYRKIHSKESKLDVAERNGILDKIYTIISNMIRRSEEC